MMLSAHAQCQGSSEWQPTSYVQRGTKWKRSQALSVRNPENGAESSKPDRHDSTCKLRSETSESVRVLSLCSPYRFA